MASLAAYVAATGSNVSGDVLAALAALGVTVLFWGAVILADHFRWW